MCNGDILRHVQMWKQAEILEHKSDPAPLRGQSGDVTAADQHASAFGPVKAGNRLKRHRLAGAVRSEDDSNLPAGYGKIDLLETEGAERKRERLDRGAHTHRLS